MFIYIDDFGAPDYEGNDHNTCNVRLLQFYGIQGQANPEIYKDLVNLMNNDYCPGIEYSCCSRDDFETTGRYWLEKITNIKKYLTKVFRVH